MYLNPQIHDTQDTLTIHVGYIGIPSRIRISSSTCGRVWMREGTNLRYMYMYLIIYLGCIPHVSWLPLQIHVSRMYPACILHLRYVPLRIHLRYTYPNMYLGSIPHVSLMYPRTTADTFIPHVSLINLACIFMYPDCILKCRHDASKIHVSWFCISVYLEMYRDEESKIHVSWCILICIQCDIKEAHRIHVSWCILCVSEMYLRLVWDTCKIHAKCQDTCILLECTCNRAFKIHLRYIKIHPGYMYSTGYTHDTSRYNS